MRVALLGANGSGKKHLANALIAALSGPGRPALLVTTINNARYLGDSPLQDGLREQPGAFDLTLLMGLDLPSPDGADLARERESVDQRLRQALARDDVAYQVIYGVGRERLHNTLNTPAGWLARSPASPTPTVNNTDSAAKEKTRWVWACDKCSDPPCERRLLSDLLATRVGPGRF